MFRVLVLFLFLHTTVFAQNSLKKLEESTSILAFSNAKEALAICDSVLALKDLSDLYRGVFTSIKGKAYYFRGDYKEAGKLYLEATSYLEKENATSELGLLLNEQAKLYRKLKMYPQAIEAYSKARDIFEEINDPLNLATVLNEWGVVYEMTEDYPKAMDFFTQSLKLKEQLNDSIGIAYSYAFISNIHLVMGDFKQAEDYGIRSFEIFKGINQPLNLALQSSFLAGLYETSKAYNKAIYYLDYSDSLVLNMNYRDLLSENYRKRADLYSKMGDFKSAYTYHLKHVTLKDSLFNASTQKTIAELNVQYETAEKDRSILQQENILARQRWYLAFAILLFAGMATVAWFIYRNRKIREKQLLQESEHKAEILRMEALNNLQSDRLRISRDLHDNIGSYLTYLNTSIDHLKKDNREDEKQLGSLKELTLETISELRRTVWLINKSSIDLEEWVIKLKDHYRSLPLLTVKAELPDEEIILSSVQATALFRIVQEAVNNAVKYSEGNRIIVSVELIQRYLTIRVSDNGKGFETSSTKHGFGLENMRQRARELNGDFSIESTQGEGTTITVSVHT
jgi:signal transduction histidine kinase